MLNFDYYNNTRLIFGKGEYKNIGEYLKPYQKRILLHYGGGSIKKSGLYDAVINSLNSAGIQFFELPGAKPNPTADLVYRGIDICRNNDIGLVLAVGGGSVIDSAKSIALGACYDGDVWDFYSKDTEPSDALPVAAILTIPAAGSEQSPDAVISNGGRKTGFTSLLIRPVLSVISPELFFTLPHNQMAYGVCDMICHTTERYFTNTKNTGFVDGLCESTIRTIMKNALILNGNLQDYDAWAEIGAAGSFCHNTFLSMGRETDWACHKMEHEISAAYPEVAHGAGLAILLPAWMRYVYKQNEDMFLRFAFNIMGVDNKGSNDKIINTAIDKFADFLKTLGLPSDFRGLGINSPDIEAMAKKCTGVYFGKEVPVGHFKQLYWQDVMNIYNTVL